MDKEKSAAILAEVLEKEISEIAAFPPDAPLEELGFNSIRFISFVVRAEEEFGIEVNDSDLLISNFETINSVCSVMSKYFDPPAALKKVLILDCDNVLWSGIAGEEQIYINENNIRFQNAVLDLYRSGVLLCICSKNENYIINIAFSELDMPIKKEHFIIEKIDRADKVFNIKKIAEELNLPADSFVFADDSDYELGLVKSMIKGITVVKVDYADENFIEYICSLFGSPSHNTTDRTRLYREQKEREMEKHSFSSVDEYNDSLQTKVRCERAIPEQSGRLAELSKRTNQFNLSDRRYSEDEITVMMESGNHCIIFLSASDKYGDMGIVGFGVVNIRKRAVIEAFFISCRVFDRGFETIMLNKIKEMSDGKEIAGIYVPTDKNKRYNEFYHNNGVRLYEQL